MASNNMLVLLLTITLFSLLNATATRAEATETDSTLAPRAASTDRAARIPLWVRPRVRQLLGLTVGSTQVDTVVANDGSGNHTTISAAVAGAPPRSKKRYIIYIKRGTYKENVEIRRKNMTLIGDGIGQTIISGSRSNGTGYSTPRTATVSVHGHSFMARDLTIENTAADPDDKQAVALLSNSKNSVFYRCEIKGFQDTLYAENHLQFYRDCEISGTVDFVFGNAKAVFQNCILLARRPTTRGHNVITAQGRNGPDHASGFSFQNCNVTTREDLTGVETYLGRPWGKHSHVVFMQSYLDKIVHPSGWVPWNKSHVLAQTSRTVFYGEYMNTGPGADVSHRVKWPGFHVMDGDKAEKYTVEQFIHGNKWLPATGVEYKPGL